MNKFTPNPTPAIAGRKAPANPLPAVASPRRFGVFTLSALLATFSAALFLAAPAPAQTNLQSAIGNPQSTNAPAPANPDTFFASVQNYFTTLTDLPTFQNQHAAISLATEWQSGQASATLIVEPRIYKSFTVESFTTGANIGGTFTRQGLGLGYHYVLKDVDLGAYAIGNYRFDAATAGGKKLGAEIGLLAKKALTTHTYGFLGFGAPIGSKTSPVFRFGTGFTF